MNFHTQDEGYDLGYMKYFFSSNHTYDLICVFEIKWEKALYRCLINSKNLVQHDLNDSDQG